LELVYHSLNYIDIHDYVFVKLGGIQAKKSSSTSYNGNNMGIGLPYFNMAKKPDPYPQSLVVRVRFRDGGK
jgi:hypothetical protein